MNIKNLLLSVMTILVFSANGQTIVSVEHLNSYSKTDLINLFSGISFSNGADAYKVVYNTIDLDGNPTIASGALYIPLGCTNFAMGVYQHGTVFDREIVPSRGEEPVGLAFAGFGYATIAPDYLGLGDNDIDVHPYLHAESQATVAVDLLRAGRDFIADSLSLIHNDELFITGYSQGGHAAMALHKYIEDNNLLGEFNIIASAPLSGPYDLAYTQVQAPIIDSIYSIPTYLPYLIESMQSAYGNIYMSPSDCYLPPYDSTIVLYQNGTIDIETFGLGLPNNIYDILQPAYLDAFIGDSVKPYTNPFRVALSLNSNYDWTPQRPVRMVYCTSDEQVFYQNALLAETTMNANGAPDVEAALGLANGTHSTCLYPALLSTIAWFEGKKTACQSFPVSTNRVDYSEAVAISPNPTQGLVQLDITELPTSKPLLCKIISMSGQVISEQTLVGEMYPQLSLNDQPKGMYILTLSNEDVRVQRKITLF